jgi:hypothetical protein
MLLVFIRFANLETFTGDLLDFYLVLYYLQLGVDCMEPFFAEQTQFATKV